MKIPTEYQDRYMWPKWLRIIQAVLLVLNALLVILAVFTCTFSPIFVTNVLWAGFLVGAPIKMLRLQMKLKQN